MRITQQEIARLAGVSQATVSRVLAGDARVEVSIRDRVRQVMAEHNYKPDVRARSLRSKKTGLIGLVLRRPPKGLAGDPFFASFLSEIMDHLAETPYHLCVQTTASESGEEAIYDEMLRSRRVDGLILVESEARDERIHLLQQDKFPFVLIGNPLENQNVWSVDNDNVQAATIATKHLLDQGYGRVGMIAGPKGITVSNDRIEGYCAAVEGAGGVSRLWHSGFGASAAQEVATEVLARDDRPDALVVLDDFMALGVVQAARALELRIPDDVGLVSFNDTMMCDLVEHGLTSVSLNIPQIVEAAVTSLLDIIGGRAPSTPERVVVPCELKIRGSSTRLWEVAPV
jgi:DNA-binding LacI/PurR family transcriptional regulator